MWLTFLNTNRIVLSCQNQSRVTVKDRDRINWPRCIWGVGGSTSICQHHLLLNFRVLSVCEGDCSTKWQKWEHKDQNHSPTFLQKCSHFFLVPLQFICFTSSRWPFRFAQVACWPAASLMTQRPQLWPSTSASSTCASRGPRRWGDGWAERPDRAGPRARNSRDNAFYPSFWVHRLSYGQRAVRTAAWQRKMQIRVWPLSNQWSHSQPDWLSVWWLEK